VRQYIKDNPSVTDIPSWREQQEGETSKAWATFQKYRDMPIIGEGSRSYGNLAKLVNLKSTSGIEAWSVKNNWKERVTSYDKYMSERSIVLKEESLEVYQTKVVHMETSIAAVGGNIILDMLIEMRAKQRDGQEIDTMDIKRLTSSLLDISVVARRASGMATSFKQETSEEHDLEGQSYIVEGS
jgi:hypothetical protein